jgi:hypothetical protein
LPVLSLTGAYRWFSKWQRATHLLRAWLNLMCDPPIKTDGFPDPLSLRHLDAAFPSCHCSAAAFQNRFQVPVCG